MWGAERVRVVHTCCCDSLAQQLWPPRLLPAASSPGAARSRLSMRFGVGRPPCEHVRPGAAVRPATAGRDGASMASQHTLLCLTFLLAGVRRQFAPRGGGARPARLLP